MRNEFLAKLAADLAERMKLDAEMKAIAAARPSSSHADSSHRRSTRAKPRILFRPVGAVAHGLTDAQYHAKNDTSPSIGVHYAKAVRVRSTDLVTPRYVAGEHKGIKAEGYYATKLWTEKALEKELKKL